MKKKSTGKGRKRKEGEGHIPGKPSRKNNATAFY
jgi:hypothetical protein